MNDKTVDNPFGTQLPAETSGASAVALAQREVAEVQSAMVVAKQFPRDQKAAMDKIITSCTRESLAQQAVYQYARGGTNVEGPSIRLAEELARGWGNIAAGVAELSRGNGVSECLAYAWDLESGYRDEKRFQVRHWRDTRSGGYALTDERDIYEHIANQGSRRKRACILAVVPGDVTEAAVRQCQLTLRTSVEITPELIDSLVEKFKAVGVNKELIEKRIQRRIDSITPALVVNLGNIYNSIKDGMSGPSDWFDISRETPASTTTLDELTGNGKSKEAQPQPETKPEPEPQPQPQDESAPPQFTAAEIQKMIDDAKSIDQVEQAMDLIGSLSADKERSALRQDAIKKHQELSQ